MLLLVHAVYAQTIVPGGNVSGTWNAAGSPYLVQGSINISSGSTLNIESAVEVEFQRDYSLTDRSAYSDRSGIAGLH